MIRGRTRVAHAGWPTFRRFVVEMLAIRHDSRVPVVHSKALAARTKAERKQDEASAGPDKEQATAAYVAAKKRFGKLHGMAMVANFVVVGVLCWHVSFVGGSVF